MDSITCQANEKNTPIWKEIEPHEPTKARRRRVFLVRTLWVFTVLFLWWSSGFSHFWLRKTVIHADEDGGFGFEDFDKVGHSDDYMKSPKAHLFRSPPVRN
jgi:hypothetical protein